MPALFGEKEGKIARANHGREPLFLFAALQRQLNYPEVPRPRPKDDTHARMDALQTKLREMEARLRLVEGELRGHIHLIASHTMPQSPALTATAAASRAATVMRRIDHGAACAGCGDAGPWL